MCWFSFEICSTFGKYIDEKCEEAKRSPQKPEHQLSILEQLLKIDRDLAFVMTFELLLAGTDTVRFLLQLVFFFIIFIYLDF